jgi:hypothetical protein
MCVCSVVVHQYGLSLDGLFFPTLLISKVRSFLKTSLPSPAPSNRLDLEGLEFVAFVIPNPLRTLLRKSSILPPARTVSWRYLATFFYLARGTARNFDDERSSRFISFTMCLPAGCGPIRRQPDSWGIDDKTFGLPITEYLNKS